MLGAMIKSALHSLKRKPTKEGALGFVINVRQSGNTRAYRMHGVLHIASVDAKLGGLVKDQRGSKVWIVEGEKAIPVLGFCNTRDR